MQYAEAHRHALLTAERLLEKAESLEEATNAYYCKAREALMQAGMCQAAKGKRALGHGLGQTKDYFQRAEADFLAAVEALRRLPQPSQRTSTSGSGELTVEGQPVPAGLGEFLCAIQKQACVPECEAEIPGVGTMAVLAMDEAQPAVPPATVSAEAELGKEPSLSEVSSLTQPELTDVEGSPSRDPELGNEPGVDSGGVHTLI
ncbi:unnamed protein product [Effrenium voratum]|nr:unnamed protein product [Effrenium voratum]